MKRLAGACAALAVVSVVSSAAAQRLPQGVLNRGAPSLGSENVASSGFEAPRITVHNDEDDGTELKLSAGGLFAAGNSRSLAATGSSKLYVRRGENQLTAALAGSYGESAAAGEAMMRTSVENIQAKLRFDRFVFEHFAVFLANSGLRDRFQGLALRLNLDPGLAYYFLNAGKHRFWSEGGYDVQYDFRTEQAVLEAASKGQALTRAQLLHSGRLFVGYANAFSDKMTIDTGLEYLQALRESRSYRLNWDLGLGVHISNDFSVALTLLLRYDHNPLPNVKSTDVSTAVSLVYQLL